MTDNRYAQVFTPANIVTTIRIVLIPIFVVVILAPWPEWFLGAELQNSLRLVQPWFATAVFALLAFTDSLDGYLARSRNEVTTLGKFLDPLADKILVTAALLALVELGELPTWVALVIIAREFLVSGLRMVVSAEGHVIAASLLGKVKTVFQIIALICFIAKSNPELQNSMGESYTLLYVGSWVIMLVALLLTLLSMAAYFAQSSKVLALPFKGNAVAEDLAAQVLEAAKSHGLWLACAESCTGGLVAKMLTDAPGASSSFKGGVVSYANEVKCASLGVNAQTLACYGAVSRQTACEMAAGALTALGADCAVSTTGVAGPTGGSTDKPVGTVWIGLACKASANNQCVPQTDAYEYHFVGNRKQIREQAANAALELLLDYFSKTSRNAACATDEL